jgi:hypothetical protein
MNNIYNLVLLLMAFNLSTSFAQELAASVQNQIEELRKFVKEDKNFKIIAEDKSLYSEHETCEFIKNHLAKEMELTVYCGQEYLHFCPVHESHLTAKVNEDPCLSSSKVLAPKKTSPLKIGGFNVFHMGKKPMTSGGFPQFENLFFKDLKTVAEIINKFDVLAAVELKHFNDDFLAQNKLIVEALSSSQTSFSFAEKTSDPLNKAQLAERFYVPDYIKVLRNLKSINSPANWSLILSPNLKQELTATYQSKKSNPILALLGLEEGLVLKNDITNFELGGIFYQAQKVRPTKLAYCGGKNVACTANAKDFEARISRHPFLANLKNGNKDFIIGAYHAPFRSPTLSEKLAGRIIEQDWVLSNGESLPPLLDGGSPVYMPDFINLMNQFNPSNLVLDAFDKKTKEKYSRSFGIIPPVEKNKKEETEYWIKPEFSARYADVKVVVDFFAKLSLVKSNKSKKSINVIAFGDYNMSAFPDSQSAPFSHGVNDINYQLEHQAWYHPEFGILSQWKNFEVQVNTLTSVGNRNLSSYYDHFVLNLNQDLAVCKVDEKTGGAFDFTDKTLNLDIQELVISAKSEKYQKELKAELKKNILISKSKKGDFTLKNRFNFKIKDEDPTRNGDVLWNLFDHHITKNPKYVQDPKYPNDPERTILEEDKDPNSIYRALISDHLPIYINCF